MKIHIDGVNLDSTSGPNSFAMRLSKQLLLLGHELDFEDGRSSDVSLVFIQPSGRPLAKKIVQRLDGIWSKSRDIETMNAPIRKLYDTADAVIFQSAFDMRYINSLWGQPVKTGLFRVINNGIHVSDRESSQATLEGLRYEFNKIFVCSAHWHRQKRLVENIACFRALKAAHYPNSCLIIMGNSDGMFPADKSIFYGGQQPHSVCLQVFEEADWMINLEFFSHSPNAVVEALSVGCPVICMAQGGCAELVKGYGVLIDDPAESQAIEQAMGRSVEYDTPPVLTMHTALGHLPSRTELGQHADIDIVSVTSQYLKLFDKIITA